MLCRQSGDCGFLSGNHIYIVIGKEKLTVMKGKCRLCDKDTELRESHVIPSFVYRWLKETSGTGFLRFGLEPNKRAQDGYRLFWLCDECEGRLNEWETKLANEIFHPLNKGLIEKVAYGPWFLKFCTSVSWRVMNLILEEDGISHYPQHLQDSALKAQEIWKEFLLDKREYPNRNEQHFLPLDAIESFTHQDMPSNINRYILRSIDIDAVWGGKSAFVYSKLGRFIVLGFIEMPQLRQWVGTKVHVKHGVVGPSSYTLPVQFGEYLMDKARRAADLQRKLSDKQNKKIEESYRKDMDRAANSESFRAMSEDVRLSGSKAFRSEK